MVRLFKVNNDGLKSCIAEYNNSQNQESAIIRLPLNKVKEFEEKEDTGVIAKGMTAEEIEASRKLLEETAPKPKNNIVANIWKASAILYFSLVDFKFNNSFFM